MLPSRLHTTKTIIHSNIISHHLIQCSPIFSINSFHLTSINLHLQQALCALSPPPLILSSSLQKTLSLEVGMFDLLRGDFNYYILD